MGCTYVDKLLLALVLGPARLVLEDHIVVPPPLHIEILLVQQGVSQRNISLPLLLLGGGALGLLLLAPLGLFPSDLLQLALQLRLVVVAILLTVVVVIIVLLFTVVGVYVARLLQYAPPFGFGVLAVVVAAAAALTGCERQGTLGAVGGCNLLGLRRGRGEGTAVGLGEVGGLGGQEFGAQVADFVVSITALSGLSVATVNNLVRRRNERQAEKDLPVFQLGVCREESLMVRRAAQGLLAAGGIEGRSVGGSHVGFGDLVPCCVMLFSTAVVRSMFSLMLSWLFEAVREKVVGRCHQHSTHRLFGRGPRPMLLDRD